MTPKYFEMDTGRDVPNLGPNLNAGFWACSSLACAFLSLRLYCKLKRHVSLQYDDYLLVMSWIVQVACSVLVSIDVAKGFGKHTEDVIAENGPENIVPISLNQTIVGFLMMLSATWSKTSFAVTLLRITNGKIKTLLWMIIITMNVFMTVGALSLFLQCSPVEKSWDKDIPGTCWHELNTIAGMFSCAYSALMDFVLALLPWPLIWHLKMKTKEKIGVAVAMSMGICAGATAIVKCYYLGKPHGEDFFYEGGKLVIWGSAEVATTIMAASIPVLRVLIRDFRESVAWYRHSGSFRGAMRSFGRKSRRISGHIAIADHQQQMPRSLNDEGSEKSTESWADSRGITRTQEVHIRYDHRTNVHFDDEIGPDGLSRELEMRELG
ncbi:hypothetical protein F5Y13DRAFT_171333 [Hypoxylon sp. FL1857]|nr:hypothetical protein F5Y13DRAFT_171333 [Hypoxylon sp. FL1857]